MRVSYSDAIGNRIVITTHLKRLSVPILDPIDAGHLVQAIGEIVQLFNAVCESYGQFLAEKL